MKGNIVRFKYMALSVMMSLLTFSCIANAGNQDPKDIKFKRKGSVTESDYIFFTPFLKIACMEVNQGEKDKSKRYLYCQRDDGYFVTLYALGNAEGKMPDKKIGPLDDQQFYMQGPVLRYDTWWSNHDFACISEKDGLTCKNREGNGFFLSSEKFEPKHIPENF